MTMGKKIEMTEDEFKKIVLILKCSKRYVNLPPNNLFLGNLWRVSSKLDFDLLPDYTNSEPTGKYNGKMWKGQFNTTKGKKWFLAWCHDENEVSNLICISYREILVV